MSRYTIQNELVDDCKNKEIIDVKEIERNPNHVYRSEFFYKGLPRENIYKQDPCLNRYDLNQTIIDKLVSLNMLSKLWVIDPEYINMDMAIELAKLGRGMYISDKYRNMWEIMVLRYLAGEKLNSVIDASRHNTQKFLYESEYAKADLEDYIYTFKVEHEGYTRYDKELYFNENERALSEEVKCMNKR